ncbi:tetratricopeptide repeat protein [bacterium]|nr:tetratricopeptide repeat protein [bacterium]
MQWISRLLITLAVCLGLGAVACGDGSADHERRGDKYMLSGSYDDALAEYLMAQRIRGVTPELVRKIGKVYVKKSDFFQAKSYLDRYFSTLDAEPDSSVLLDYFQIAIERGQAGDNATKVKALEEILRIAPNYSLGPYFFDLAEFYYAAGDYSQAIGYFQRGLPLELSLENRPLYLFHLAECYEKQQDWSNAFLYFDQFLTVYPQDPHAPEALWHRGNCCWPLASELFEKEELDQALYYVDQIIDSGQPQHYVDDAYFLRGEILLKQESFEEARAAYRQVLKLNRYYYKERIADLARRRILEIDTKKKAE